MQLHQKAIEAISKQNPLQRYQYFMRRVADFETMYGLRDKQGNWASAVTEEHDLFSVWPAPEFAKACAVGDWGNYGVTEITVEMFQEEIKAALLSTGSLVNVFSVSSKAGFIVSPAEFSRDLQNELDQYE